MFQFQLGEVCQFAAHQENGRLMGFVVEGSDWSDGDEEGELSFSAFVFESNTEGEKVYTQNKNKQYNNSVYQMIFNVDFFFVFIHRYATL